MTAKHAKKLRLVLDAVIVIKAHELAIWEEMKSKICILLPSTVVNDEAFYFDTEPGVRRFAISLSTDIAAGMIIQEAATPEELRNLQNIFDNVTLGGLDLGETEALALIHSGRFKDAFFCTSDMAAIRALALMGYSDNGISLEEILKKIGLKKPLEDQYTQSFFNQHLSRGKMDRITGTGLKI